MIGILRVAAETPVGLVVQEGLPHDVFCVRAQRLVVQELLREVAAQPELEEQQVNDALPARALAFDLPLANLGRLHHPRQHPIEDPRQDPDCRRIRGERMCAGYLLALLVD